MVDSLHERADSGGQLGSASANRIPQNINGQDTPPHNGSAAQRRALGARPLLRQVSLLSHSLT